VYKVQDIGTYSGDIYVRSVVEVHGVDRRSWDSPSNFKLIETF
jgi:hypothetical protein